MNNFNVRICFIDNCVVGEDGDKEEIEEKEVVELVIEVAVEDEEEDEETDRFQRALVFGKKSSQALTWACGVYQSFFPFLSLPLSLLSLSPSLPLSLCLCLSV